MKWNSRPLLTAGRRPLRTGQARPGSWYTPKSLAKAVRDAIELITHLQLRPFEKEELNEEPNVSEYLLPA